MQTLMQDVRYALRQLRKSPGFTLTAVLTLALGTGVTAAVWSVVQTVLFAPLPYPQSDRLVGVAWTFPHEKANDEQAGSSADFLRAHTTAFSSLAVIDDGSTAVNLSLTGNPAAQIQSQRVSRDFFATLGVAPRLGRGFTEEEDRAGGPSAVVLSDALWRRVFGGDAAIVGKTIRLDQESYTVVGVMPASFAVSSESAPGAQGITDAWRPLQLGPKDPGYDGDNYQMIGRLREGVTLAQVNHQLASLQRPFYEQHPDYKKWFDNAHSLHEFRAWSLQDVMVSDVRRSLLTIAGAVMAVLLLACLNLAGLMVARTVRRSQELSVRVALGATPGTLLRLHAAEGLVLAVCSAALGLLVASVSTKLLLHASPLALPATQAAPGMGTMLTLVTVASLLAAGTFSVLPALVMLGRFGRQLRLGSRSLGETVSSAKISRILMVAQVALAMLLISASSLLLGTFLRLRALPAGVEPKALTIMQVNLKGHQYASTLKTAQFVTSVVERFRQTPGVDGVAAVNGLPLDRGLNIGGSPGVAEHARTVEFRTVTPGYFQAMGIPLRIGRDIAESDRADSAPVVVIGETAAKKWWPGKSPIGETVRIGNERNWRVVGVVADVATHSLVETQGIVIYGPMVQLTDQFTGIMNNWFPTTFVVKTGADVDLADAARRAVAESDPEIPVARLSTMQSVIDQTMQEPRFFSLLASSFSAFALVLTVIGMFGLLSYQVTQRTREIGVRMALGADRWKVLSAFLVRGMTLAGIGAGIGSAASWMVRPVIAHLLSDVGIDAGSLAPGMSRAVLMDPSEAIVISACVLIGASLIASWLPAHRASRVDPMLALRSE